jgi:hypothetical protein
MYLGDFAEDATLDFKWATNDAAGASITRATDGTVSVYVGNSATQLTTGVTDTEDFDSVTGVHHCRIDLSSSATYAPGSECQVVLSGATIDGESVSAVLAHFSIERAGGALALLKGANGLAALKGDTAAILVDTDELQTDWANGGRLDLILDARASQASVDTVDSNVDAVLADTGTDGVAVAAGAKTGYSLAADQSGVTIGTVNSLASGAIAAASLAAAACAKVADVVLRRTFANARGSSDGDTVGFRSLLGAVAKLVNRIDTTTNAGKLTTFAEDDSTELGTQTLSTDGAAEPIVSADTD